MKQSHPISKLMSAAVGTVAALVFAAGSTPCRGSIVLLNGTTTYSATAYGRVLIADSTDGNTGGSLGWHVYTGGLGINDTAVWETQTDVNPGGANLAINLFQNFGSFELLGKFKLSVTTTNRSLFASGLDNDPSSIGDPGIWTALHPTSVTSLFVPSGNITINPDGSVLFATHAPDHDTYTIVAPTALTGITGLRLDALTDPSLPGNGPGFQGNFVLSEITLDVVPEPATLGLLGLGGLLVFCLRHGYGGAGRRMRGSKRQ